MSEHGETMSDTPAPRIGRQDERGMALVAVLLLLMMMSALGMALAVSGETETLIARNQIAGMQAQAAAEAGLNHAVEVATQYIFDWKSNGFASIDVAVDTVLANADAGNLNGLVMNTPLTISAGFNAEYEVSVLDDDDNGVGEDGDPLNDANDVLVVRATGLAQDGTKVVLEALLSPRNLPAILTNGDLSLSGNASVEGSSGSVHANGGLTIDGDSVSVSGDVSSTGTLDCEEPCDQVDGTATEGAPEITVPAVHASEYLDWADYILNDDGTMTDPSGAVLCVSTSTTSCNNWDWDSASRTWSINSNSVTAGTYYVEGHATVSGSPGSTKNPAEISIIAEGSIQISGSPKLAPDSPELLFVTDQDLKITGTIDTVGEAALVEGQMLVRGQATILGNASLNGQLIVEDLDVGDLVTSNTIGGSVTITYTGGLLGGVFTVTSWRDVRDAN
jgi:PilX N-terminal